MPLTVAAVIAAVIVTAAYSNHFANSFHFDDSHAIEQNLYLRSLTNVPRFFTDAATFSSLTQNATYRPLLSVTYALDYWVAGGLDSRQFHRTQFTLLLLLGALLIVLFRRLLDLAQPRPMNAWAALVGATFFCLHTGNTETLNYISARSDLLSTLFVVAAFVVYLEWPAGRRWRVPVLLMALGVLVKTPAVIFAPLLLAFALLYEQQLTWRDVFAWDRRRQVGTAVLTALPALVVAALVFVFVERMNPPGQTYGGEGRLSYALTQPFVWFHYLRLFILPLGLTADTDWGTLSNWYDTRLFAGVLGLGILALVAWRAARTEAGRPIAFGIVWFALALLPASSVVPLAEVANEHRIFFPYIGLVLVTITAGMLALDHLGARWPSARPALAGGLVTVAVLVLAGHALGTYQRNTVWRNEASLWRDVVAKSPGNGRAWMNYGLTMMGRGRFAEARDLFERALPLTPNYPHLETNLGIVYGHLGQPAVAERHFRRAIELAPGFAEGHSFYGRWLLDQARPREAIAMLERAAALAPGLPDPRATLMALHYAAGDATALAPLVATTLRVRPGDPAAAAYRAGQIPMSPAGTTARDYFELGLRMTAQQRHLDAAVAYRRAVGLDPEYADALNNLGWSLGKLGLYAEAKPPLEAAQRLRPDWELARNNLTWIESEQAGRR